VGFALNFDGLQRAAPRIYAAMARAIAPRARLTVSQWADKNRELSRKGSAKPGKWVTDRNPPLREPMDNMSAHSAVHETVCMFCIQIGKTDGLIVNVVGYTMDYNPGPVMVAFPGEVSMNKFIDQKLSPAIDETPAMKSALTSVSSRDSSNQRAFKDFEGGQLYIEHAGNPLRLKSNSVKILINDEFSALAANLKGDDPEAMIDGRTSAFPGTYKRLDVSSPGVAGVCRIEARWLKSDQRRFNVPCPHCGHEQPLKWSGLHWNETATECWYVCEDCGACIEEHHKTEMIRNGRWIAENPGSDIRGYHLNCLYYPFGLGPRWLKLVRMWLDAQGDAAKLKTFINDRLAETFEDPAMRSVKHNLIADRAEPLPLRVAPPWVLAVTAGVDTHDNRLPVHIIGWGRGMTSWTLDYVELPGDPNDDAVWVSLIELINRPIQHALGGLLRVEALLQDGAGHRTEAVKNFVRRHQLRRHLIGFGAKANNAPVLNKGRLQDINWKGQIDKKGITVHQVGTVGIKHLLYGHLSADADKPASARKVRFSEDLPRDYFEGLVSEVYDPRKNRFDMRRGVSHNEELDTWVYAYAAAHHPALRLHRATKADWDAREARLRVAGAGSAPVDGESASRETSVSPLLTARGALDAIVCQIERTPLRPVDSADLAAWSAAVAGSPEERLLLQVMLDQMDGPPAPIVSLIDATLVARAKATLSQTPTELPAPAAGRRFGRGVRHTGIR
jgi:phage terminase large subunit GpA-like protein